MQSLCTEDFNSSRRKELKINGISAAIKPLPYYGGTISTIINATFPKGHKINVTFVKKENIVKIMNIEGMNSQW